MPHQARLPTPTDPSGAWVWLNLFQEKKWPLRRAHLPLSDLSEPRPWVNGCGPASSGVQVDPHSQQLPKGRKNPALLSLMLLVPRPQSLAVPIPLPGCLGLLTLLCRGACGCGFQTWKQQIRLAGEQGWGEEEVRLLPVTHGHLDGGRNITALFLGFANSHSSPSSLLPGNSSLSWQRQC